MQSSTVEMRHSKAIGSVEWRKDAYLVPLEGIGDGLRRL